ncbi:MAG TPA: amino acid permease [Vicinamibacteria bacterium]|nr:amino acid permease [Vicinamibacteria bacterium]
MAMRSGGLERALSSWQQAMIAMGGTIGVGLFLASGTTIGLAGPAVVLSYALAAPLPISVGLALAEMAPAHAEPGAFGAYAEAYIGKWASFATRLSYWFAEIFAVGAMASAIGVYFEFWFDGIPSHVFIGAAALLAVCANALNVGRFASLESVLSSIKVLAIAAFVLFGTVLVVQSHTGMTNLVSDGGFLPHGFGGIWLSLTLVVTSFLGIEAVAVTAGEAKQPERTVPRALFGVVGSLVLLYVTAMLVIVAMTPWRSIAETNGTLTGSPFVIVFRQAGIPYAGSLMNFVVISAAFTALVSHLYLSSRMLFSLARSGYVPAPFGTVDRRGIPLRALGGSTLGMCLAVIFALFGRQVFLPMYGTGVVALLSIWMLVLVCHVRYRSRRGMKFPVLSVLGVGLVVAALSATPWVEGLEWTLPIFVGWIVLITVVYKLRYKTLSFDLGENRDV